jgi:hypothetical protein
MPIPENVPANFAQLHERYTALKARFLAGAVSNADFAKACALLELRDVLGDLWRIEPHSGTWLRLINGEWCHDIPASSGHGVDPLGETSLRLAIGRHLGEWSQDAGGDDGELPPDSGIDDDFMGKCKGRILGGAE